MPNSAPIQGCLVRGSITPGNLYARRQPIIIDDDYYRCYYYRGHSYSTDHIYIIIFLSDNFNTKTVNDWPQESAKCVLSEENSGDIIRA